MVNGKAKGSSFERDICKFLTVWNGGDPKKPHFWRQPLSGGLCTIHGDENMSGDIRSIKPEGDFIMNAYSIEIKNGYPQTSLDLFLKYNKSDPLKSFWIQCVRDSVESNKMPLLIYKKKGLSTIWLGVGNELYKDNMKDKRSISLNWGKEDELPPLYIYEMKEFFDLITPDIMKEKIGCS